MGAKLRSSGARACFLGLMTGWVPMPRRAADKPRFRTDLQGPRGKDDNRRVGRNSGDPESPWRARFAQEVETHARSRHLTTTSSSGGALGSSPWTRLYLRNPSGDATPELG